MKILAIGAHYDDIEIGCVGTLLKHIQKGDEVVMAITNSDEYRTGDVIERIAEQQKALSVMGLPQDQLYLFRDSQSEAEVIGILDKVDADIIYCHHENDTHQAHRRASIISQAVGRKQHTTTLFYDSGSSYNFYPAMFSLIDYERKHSILKCYQSQIICGAINLDRVKKKNAFWATTVTANPRAYAEGFMVRKLIWEV